MRLLIAALAAVLLLPAAAAEAHPLGNFSVNHLATIGVHGDRVDVRYILDAAEIPTLQRNVDAEAEVGKLELTVDGRRVPLRPGRATTTHRPGQGGLRTTRTVIELSAAVEHP